MKRSANGPKPPTSVIKLDMEANYEWGKPEALACLYNRESPNECPAVELITPKRWMKAFTYLQFFPDQAFWRTVMRNMQESSFLRGRGPAGDRAKPFVADFDWLLQVGKDGTENVVKVYEGKYAGGF